MTIHALRRSTSRANVTPAAPTQAETGQHAGSE